MISYGIVDLPWWGYLAIALVLTHTTIASVTIYLHRRQTHRALDLHPAISHFFRFWLWLTTGMVTTAAGVINGVGHYWGYRNFPVEDASTNIVPWGILIGGERASGIQRDRRAARVRAPATALRLTAMPAESGRHP